MITKEKISINYLFFKQPTNHIMILGPLVIACATIFFSNSSFTLSESIWNDIYENQYNLIKDFLTIFKLTFVVLSSFYITYRWALFEKDGNLGYWLSQGVNKKKFFFLSFIYFYLNPLLG
ncbi:MAG: hypothetical protein HeimC2_02490 [Candidatus Heimdallarchaeota archaeon LC_2]|nr:MAG: hypothetical protein HeimC2_02490 [Candidatus Heimdallarchaeota archaeon LC_2]